MYENLVVKLISMLSLSTMVVGAAEQKSTRAVLLPPADRKTAPAPAGVASSNSHELSSRR